MNVDAVPIEQSVELTLKYPSVSERYFTHFYFMPKNPYQKTKIEPHTRVSSDTDSECTSEQQFYSQFLNFRPNGEDICVMMHSNKICVITLSPKHPIIVQKKEVSKVDFNTSGIDRLSNKVSGKGKKGAQIVGPFSPLCNLQCNDGSSHTIYCGINGKLIEVNENLLNNPSLLSTDTKAEGYLAVVLPKPSIETLKKTLLGQNEYESIYSKYPIS